MKWPGLAGKKSIQKRNHAVSLRFHRQQPLREAGTIAQQFTAVIAEMQHLKTNDDPAALNGGN
jgi:hypothetical protein